MSPTPLVLLLVACLLLPGGPGVTIAPLDAFALRPDLGPVVFEAIGNDQNYREVIQDQHGATDFRFRYSLRAHVGDYAGADVIAWSRRAATPLLAVTGRAGGAQPPAAAIEVDPARALATCLKPADGDPAGGVILRIQEIAGKAGPLRIGLRGYAKAVRTDLLERDLGEAQLAANGEVTIDLNALGLTAVRLLP